MAILGDHVLLISDPSVETPGGVYVYDGDSVDVIDRVSTSGIARAGDDHLLRLPRSLDEPGSSGELVVYDQSGVVARHRLDRIPDAHDVAWDGRRFVVVSTGSNRVAWFDRTGHEAANWQPEGDGDAWHLNNLLLHEGEVYVSAFGRFREHRGWADRMVGAGFVMTIPACEPVLDGLTAPHTPRLVDGRWLVCNSGSADLLEFDLSGRRLERRLPLRTWPRGMAVRDRLLFVGESEHRFASADPTAYATIAIVDLDDWKVLDRIEVAGREIYDLLVVPRRLADGLETGLRDEQPPEWLPKDPATFDPVACSRPVPDPASR